MCIYYRVKPMLPHNLYIFLIVWLFCLGKKKRRKKWNNLKKEKNDIVQIMLKEKQERKKQMRRKLCNPGKREKKRISFNNIFSQFYLHRIIKQFNLTAYTKNRCIIIKYTVLSGAIDARLQSSYLKGLNIAHNQFDKIIFGLGWSQCFCSQISSLCRHTYI